MMHPSERLFMLAVSLVRPVQYGWMPIGDAYAALMGDTLQMEERGELTPYQAPDIITGLFHALDTRLHDIDHKRYVTAMRIRRQLAFMIDVHKPPNTMLAEAHGINGEQNFPFAETEVNEQVLYQVWQSLPRAPWKSRRRGA